MLHPERLGRYPRLVPEFVRCGEQYSRCFVLNDFLNNLVLCGIYQTMLFWATFDLELEILTRTGRYCCPVIWHQRCTVEEPVLNPRKCLCLEEDEVCAFRVLGNPARIYSEAALCTDCGTRQESHSWIDAA